MQALTIQPGPQDSRRHEPDGPTRQPTLGRWLLALTVLTSGLSAGLFYIFEVAVTPGLATVGDRTYIEAFQGMNAVIRNLPFGIAFFGPIVLAALTMVLTRRDRRVALLVAGGLGVYILGVLGVTFGFHVPRNEQLATYTNLATTDLVAVRTWFEGPWNTMNLVRTIAACASFALFTLAMAVAPTPRR